MKKNLFFIIALSIIFVGCSKSESLSVENETDVKTDKIVQLTPILSTKGEPFTFMAGFVQQGGTKTTLALGTSSAKVYWEAGDSWRSYIYSDGIYYSEFTTSVGGVTKAPFTSPYTPLSGEQFCLYPSAEKIGRIGESTLVFGINIPNAQTAVAGGVESGLNLSYTITSDFTQDLHFKSIPAYIKFKLSGAAASQVKRVEFLATDAISGDVIIMKNSSGTIDFTNYAFSGDQKYTNVTLSGSFVEGSDYMIATLPANLTGFSMVFYDASDNYISKVSSKNLALTTSTITDFGIIDIGDTFTPADDTAPVLYMEHTQGTKPVTIAVIPEGFQSSELTHYEVLAKSAMDALFNTEPFKSYRSYFNVYILKVASNESGANITDGSGNITTPVDCYFGSKWGETSYSDMSANATKVFNFVSSNCPDIVNGIHTIAEVPVLMIINDTRYGGICHSYSDGKAYCMAPYSYGGGALSWGYPSQVAISMSDPAGGYRDVTDEERAELGSNTGDWRNTMVHEYGGHAFSRLGDEYWYDPTTASGSSISSHTWAVPFSLNVSATYTNPTWQVLLDNLAELTAIDPNYSRIGVYQGADVYMFNRWRSELISCMIDNRFYFSAWQRYLIAQRILTLSGDISEFNYEFWKSKDVTTDPIRDVSSSPTIINNRTDGVVHKVGLLPPPVLHEE